MLPIRPMRAIQTRAVYERVISGLRASARGVGYALTVHGSLSRDIDLVAVPWAHGAVEADVLADVIAGKLELLGFSLTWFVTPETDPTSPRFKPHGRRAWAFHVEPWDSLYIDLSVIPPRPQ